MAKILRFQKPSYLQRYRRSLNRRPARLRKFPLLMLAPMVIALVMIVGVPYAHHFSGSFFENEQNTLSQFSDIECENPSITDGDTFYCGGHRIRLAGIDAPEMPGHCREGRDCTDGNPYAARDYLLSLSRGAVTCHPIEKDVYGRIVAQCEINGEDLSCAMISSEHAVRRYGDISC